MTTTLRANGKLLLTGEYFVLDGVPGLAVPTRRGQSLAVREHGGDDLRWEAYAVDGSLWYSGTFRREEWAGPTQSAFRPSVAEVQPPAEDPGARIRQILTVAEGLRPGCTDFLPGHTITTRLEFDRHWGLGSSATLLACLAELLGVDPYALLERTFGGSGYDLACAVNDTPIVYARQGGGAPPRVTPVDWAPGWARDTVFVYRNQKQNSRAGIRRYREQTVPDAAKAAIAALTTSLLQPALHLRAAAHLLRQHEEIVSKAVGLPPVQEELFADFSGQIKSLGAWGGDFVWAISEGGSEKMRDYFNARGYATVIGYDEMVL